MKKAVYAGSFDPFTNGHLYIYNQAKELFDDLIVIIADNHLKKRYTDISKMRRMISGVIKSDKVIIYSGLVADYCKENGISFLVRGIRNTSDYLYEEEVAKTHNEIYSEIKTVYFRAKDDVISSTMVKLLHEHKKDIGKYVPEGIVL